MTASDWGVRAGPSYARDGLRSGLGGGDLSDRWIEAQTVVMMITA